MSMERTEYCCYALLSIFDSYYLGWIKDCNAAKFTEDFSNRLSTLSTYLETICPSYKQRAAWVNCLARKKSYEHKRRLSLSINSVKFGDKDKCSTNTAIQVRFLTRNSSYSNNYDLYNCRVILRIEEDYQIHLDIPIEMNNPKTKVYIEFLYITDHQSKETYTSRTEAFYTVKEYEISGFSGHSKSFCFIDLETNKEVSYQMSLRWEVASESLLEHISNPQVIIEHFSGFMLSIGSYFWRFYSGLYSQLLLDARTRALAIKMLNEVFFVIGSSNRQKMVSTLLHLTKEMHHDRIECTADECQLTFKLLHACLLCFEMASEEYQSKMIEHFFGEPFGHFLRLSCQSSPWKHQAQLVRILLRSFRELLKKRKHNSSSKLNPANQFDSCLNHFSSWLEDFVKLSKMAPSTEASQLEDLHNLAKELLQELNKSESNGKKLETEKTGEGETSTGESEWSTDESSSNEKTSDLETTGTQLESDISSSHFVETKERDIKHELIINGKATDNEIEDCQSKIFHLDLAGLDTNSTGLD